MGFDPITLGIIATTAAIGSAGISAAGSVAQGKAQSNAARYQAQVAKNNATIMEQNATYATQAGQAAALNESQKGAVRLASTKARQAANGIDINTGSAVAVRAGEAETGRLDTLTTAHNALITAYGYRTQATNDTAQAGLDEATARNAKLAGYLDAGAGLLGNASSLAGKWGSLQQPSGAYTPGSAGGGVEDSTGGWEGGG